MAKEFMYVKLTKEWGGFSVDDVIRFGYNKGESRIREGFGVEVPKQKAVNDRVTKRPEVETANRNPLSEPETETAEVTPKKKKKKTKPDMPTEADMPAEADTAYKRARNK